MAHPGTPNLPSSCFEFDALRAATNYRVAMLREFSLYLRGRVIEIGAGAGQFTELLRAMPGIDTLVSVEPNARFCQTLREAYPSQLVIAGTIDAVRPDAPWDAILSVNVLEHIEADERELGIYRTLLAKNRGMLCLFVPARPEIYAPMDRDFGHFRRYTRVALRRQLERAGFQVRRLEYFNSVGYLAWWFTFCVLKRRRFNAAAVRFFDRRIFPLVYWLESRMASPPVGQSLLSVAQAFR